MQINFTSLGLPKAGTLVVFAGEKAALHPTAAAVNEASGGRIATAAKAARFEGKKDQMLEVLAPGGLSLERVLVYGLGKADKLTAHDWEVIGANIRAKLANSGAKAATVALDEDRSGQKAAGVATGMVLRAWRFDKYRTKEGADKKPTLQKATIMTTGVTRAKRAFATAEQVNTGVFLTRELVSEPGNILTPVNFAERIKELTKLGVQVTILNEAEMKRLGMGALLGVAQGSANPPRMVIMEWNGNPKAAAKRKSTGPVAFIGKGVTFDSGGISLKPGPGMEQMKWDMGGAGAVVGAMCALAARKSKAHVVAAVGLVENMPSGTAQRPGDVVTSMSGQTIEILNTDAEGRLVLADALWYVKETYKPRLMVDLATLTGAIIIALGHEYAGMMSNDDALAKQLIGAGEVVGDKLWRFPLHDTFDRDINCAVADMKNIGSAGKAGSITAAQFLKRFVGDVPWAHLDIAGTVWQDKDGPLFEKGATGYGVRLLDRFVADNFE